MIDWKVWNRFWAKVDDGGFPPDECWEWRGCILQSGHGQFSINGKRTNAHRVSYEMAHGSIPKGKMICHRCNNPACVNPGHLYAGTSKSNAQDSIRAGTFHFIKHGLGEKHPCAKLTERVVMKIREQSGFGTSYRKLASQYGVSYGAIAKVVRRETWVHV